MFHWENTIALDTMQGNRASSCGEGEVSWLFSSCSRHQVHIQEFRHRCPSESRVCSVKSGLLSIYHGQLRNLNKAWEDKSYTSGGEAGGQVFLISWHSYIGIPIKLTKIQVSSSFEALNSASLSRFQTDVRPPVHKRWIPKAFSRVSTGDSDIPSSCEMKEVPAFKPLQGNPAFF